MAKHQDVTHHGKDNEVTFKEKSYLEGREGRRGKKSTTWTKMVVLKNKTITNFV